MEARLLLLVKKDESSDEEEDESSSEEEDVKKVDTKKAAAESSEEDDESSEESSDDDEEEEETTTKRKAATEDSTPAKRAKTNDEQTFTIFVGNLAWECDQEQLSSNFAQCGEIASARVIYNPKSGMSKGYGYVDFATSEAREAAMKLGGSLEICGREVRIDRSDRGGDAARPDAKYGADAHADRAKVFGDSTSPASDTLFLGNLAFEASEDELRNSFQDYGLISSIRLPTDRETGRPKGFAYVQFSNLEDAKIAFEQVRENLVIAGRPVRVDYSIPRESQGGGNAI